MHITCCYSGESFRVEHFSSFNISSKSSIPHPIFLLSTTDLLKRVKDWSKGDFSEVENRLLFLALLKKTNAVFWNAIPRPTEATVQRNIFPLFRLLGSADLIEDGSIPLPKYSITQDNSDLRNIHHWINSWNEAKEAYFIPSLRWELQARLDKRDKTLWRLLNSKNADTEKFSKRFAKWVFIAADVPSKQFKLWSEIFNCKLDDDKIFSFEQHDVQDCYNHLFINLSSIFAGGSEKKIGYLPAIKAIEHISKILEISKEGKISRLRNGKIYEIMDYNDPLAYQPGKDDALNFQEFKLMTNDLLNASDEKPKEKDFKSALEYMRAKAAWTLRNNSLSEGQKSVISRLQKEQKEEKELKLRKIAPSRLISSLSQSEMENAIWIA